MMQIRDYAKIFLNEAAETNEIFDFIDTEFIAHSCNFDEMLTEHITEYLQDCGFIMDCVFVLGKNYPFNFRISRAGYDWLAH